MRKLAEVIAKSQRERAEIEGKTSVAVRKAEVEASQRRLQIELEERRAEIAQAQEIETLLAAQLTEVARRKSNAEREAAQARIRMEQDIQVASIQRELQVCEAEIARLRSLEMAEQDKTIQIAANSQEESKARAEATAARAALVKAEEDIATLKQMAEAERRKRLALVAAEQDAESNARRARISAEADQEVAKAKGVIRREEAASMKVNRFAEAEAEAARIKPENSRSEGAMALEAERIRLEKLPAIVSELVKPVEKIKGININHVTSLERPASGSAQVSPVSQTIDSILDMAVALPAMKKVGEQIGVNLDGVAGKDKES